MSKWPDWHPPKEMIARQPYLPRFTAGGEGNPMGARALYLGNTEYRIHGTNQPSTIGHFVSSGCIRLTNEDVEDLYNRVSVGTRVVVLPGSPPVSVSAHKAESHVDAENGQKLSRMIALACAERSCRDRKYWAAYRRMPDIWLTFTRLHDHRYGSTSSCVREGRGARRPVKLNLNSKMAVVSAST